VTDTSGSGLFRHEPVLDALDRGGVNELLDPERPSFA
jgi:hypothetical protein